MEVLEFASPLPTLPHCHSCHPFGVQIDFPLQKPFISYLIVHRATKATFISTPTATVIEKAPTQNAKANPMLTTTLLPLLQTVCSHAKALEYDIYAKFGTIETSRYVFDKMCKRDVASWTRMIARYSQNGNAKEAIEVFRQMQLAGVRPDFIAIVSVLPAIADLASLGQGKEIHGYILRRAFESDVFVGSTLIDMYIKCGSMEEFVCHVFDQMSKRNVVDWNAMIGGYVQNGHANEALKLKCNRKVENAHKIFDKIYKRNPVLWNAVISGYAQNGCANEALKLFREMQLTEVKPDMVTICNCSTFMCSFNMYAKCGCIDVARYVFDKMTQKNVVSWTAMITGYGLHGHGVHALTLFEQMKEVGLKAAHITFLALLSACNHAGLVAEGQQYFNSMSRDYHIEPSVEHYAYMEDIFGCAGCLDEAHNVIKTMPSQPDVGDRSHPQSEEIYSILKTLAGQMREAGYVPDTSFVLHDVEGKEKEYILCDHNEKPAIAFGLLNTSPETPIQISKNLRVCGNCHSATKFISKIVK
eukprot:Gb_39939 [translate_table: standard]